MGRRPDWLVGQLPMGMLEDDFFVRFVSLFQDVASSLLDGVDNVPNALDVTVAPPAAVRWLGSWIGAGYIDPSLDERLQRHLVHEAGQALAWRGTRRGLEVFLRAVTGDDAIVEESGGIRTEGDGGNADPWVRVQARSTGWMSDGDFLALVADEVPANVRLEVAVGDRTIWPPAGEIGRAARPGDGGRIRRPEEGSAGPDATGHRATPPPGLEEER
jgi:phage tail-like protein